MPQNRSRKDSNKTPNRVGDEPVTNGVAPAAVASVGVVATIANGVEEKAGACASAVAMETVAGCCCPCGCLVGEPIDLDDIDDSVRVICNNPDCTVGQYMHRVCFETWETAALTYLRNSGRARNWSEKQMQQNLWTKKGFDVAYKACDCRCGHGHMRKDLDVTINVKCTEEKRRNRKKSGGKPAPGVVSNGASCCVTSMTSPCSNGGGPTVNVGPRMRSRTLSLGSAAGLFMNSSSPPNQQMAHSLGAAPKKSDSEIDFFSDVQVQNTGSIFKRRESMCPFNNILPRWKINGIHIKMEDDCPQGNDETRIFVLTSLGDQKMREVECLLCRSALPVYDRYPLLDGTFFMSPLNHGGIGVKVKHDGRDGYLLAVCVYCLENSNQLKCLRCNSTGWFPGDKLVLGTLYTFDVLASTACCSPVCSSCRNQVPVPQPHYFSTFSDPTVCPHCGHSDLHFIRHLDNVRRVNSASA